MCSAQTAALPCLLQGYPADLQLLSGKLALDVQQLCRDGVVGWVDTMAPVPRAGQRQQQAAKAAAYEEVRQHHAGVDTATATACKQSPQQQIIMYIRTAVLLMACLLVWQSR
jgi:hypothetical protein